MKPNMQKATTVNLK